MRVKYELHVQGNMVSNSGNHTGHKDYDHTKEFMYTEIRKQNSDGTWQITYLNHEKLWEHANLLQETDPDRLQKLKDRTKSIHPNYEYLTYDDGKIPHELYEEMLDDGGFDE